MLRSRGKGVRVYGGLKSQSWSVCRALPQASGSQGLHRARTGRIRDRQPTSTQKIPQASTLLSSVPSDSYSAD